MRWIKLWTHRPYAPTIVFHALRATVQGLPKHFPSRITLAASAWENAMEEYVFPEKEFSETSDALIEWAMEKREEANEFFRIAHDKSIRMREHSEGHKGKALANIGSDELISFL
ncbi:MAG: hypothetical protein ABIG96_03925 [Candidatus Micrarchaeota archaeon]